ncbi:hypothetical protein [Nocardia pseudobrasiliensis]|uniref:Uncharacterized protein n=1 Tax=Nocardia pseudobrasiliensis TaxID=45979 RepID=A0A370I599_9NOCA|nr:hypothetical protein [Nocardia pseudobrasiliensis]RDI65899.1 hypothetical protein DFR76_105217 [Nocardia pseudobrasiliensis]
MRVGLIAASESASGLWWAPVLGGAGVVVGVFLKAAFDAVAVRSSVRTNKDRERAAQRLAVFSQFLASCEQVATLTEMVSDVESRLDDAVSATERVHLTTSFDALVMKVEAAELELEKALAAVRLVAPDEISEPAREVVRSLCPTRQSRSIIPPQIVDSMRKLIW